MTAEKLVINSAGNVGIGTTGPLSKLDVNGGMAVGSYAGVNTAPSNGMIVSGVMGLGVTSVTSGAKLESYGPVFVTNVNANSFVLNSAGTNYGTIQNATDIWSLGTSTSISSAGTPVLTWTKAGNVGIGTTSPLARLGVIGADSLNTSFAGNISGLTGTGLVITNAGNVGIGTTSPGYKLEVAGDMKVSTALNFSTQSKFITVNGGDLVLTSQSAAGAGVLRISPNGSPGVNKSILQLFNTDWAADQTNYELGQVRFSGDVFQMGTFAGGTGTNRDMAFLTSSTERVRITSTGNVGIGTTGPGGKLDVQGGNLVVGNLTLSPSQSTNFGIAGTQTADVLSTTNYGIKTTNRIYQAIGSTAALQVADASNVVKFIVDTTNSGVGINYNSPGTAALAINGNVGIGTTGPSGKLHVIIGNNFTIDTKFTTSDFVYGSVGSGLSFQTGAATGNTYSSIAAFSAGGSTGNNLVLNPTSGNVGIGTTAPGARLHLTEADTTSYSPDFGNPYATFPHNILKLTNDVTSDTASNKYAGLAFEVARTAGGNAVGLISLVDPDGSAFANSDLTFSLRDASTAKLLERVRITGAGNVGIGTTAPGQKLSVVGDIGLSGANRFIGLTDNYALSLKTNNSDRLWITNAGNVGIGTTAPSFKLEVNGGSSYGAMTIGTTGSGQVAALGFEKSNGNWPAWIGIQDTNRLDFAVASNVYPSDALSGYTRMSIDSSGNVGIGTTGPLQKLHVAGGARITTSIAGTDDRTLCTEAATGDIEFVNGACGTSSRRYKENIKEMAYGLDEINRLNPVFFNYTKDSAAPSDLSLIDDRTKRRIGFIAEDLQEVIPEVVIWQGGNVESIDYAYLVSLLTKGVQELSSTVDSLSLAASRQQKQIDELRGMVGIGSLNGEGSLGGVTPITEGMPTTLTEVIKNALESLGLTLKDGVASFKELVVDKIFAKKARLEKLEMVDQTTGDIYCTWISNGEWVKVRGECDSIETSSQFPVSSSQTNPTPPVDSPAVEVQLQPETPTETPLETVTPPAQEIIPPSPIEQIASESVVEPVAPSADSTDAPQVDSTGSPQAGNSTP
ncbi:MAG: tail fiber domain-containing protein [bacterium]